jgi:Prokaryotic homologs of the JAB domain
MTFERVPATLRYYRVSAETIEVTRDFLRRRGEEGFEAVVLWLGKPEDEQRAEIVAPYVPEQIAYRSADGVAVRVSDDGLSTLISALPAGVFVLCRVHSHPGPAFHSETDDDNMIISHQGAISIVVPFFAREPIEPTRCSINELDHATGWRELNVDEIRERFQVVP